MRCWIFNIAFCAFFFPSCGFTYVKQGDTRVITTADLWAVLHSTSTWADGGIASALGNVSSVRATNSVEGSRPGTITAGDITVTGTVQHSPAIAETWWGLRGLARVWAAVDIGTELIGKGLGVIGDAVTGP